MVLWFGKYRGVALKRIPESYLCWLADNVSRESIRRLANDELDRRANERQRPPIELRLNDPITRELIEAGYRALAKKCHPDCGGDVGKMQQLNAAMERLRDK
jgi:hypothetical protein